MEKRREFGIIAEVAIFFLIGILIIGSISYFGQRAVSYNSIKTEMESVASRAANEVEMAVREYPAARWLLRYWYYHYDEMDIDYDADFSKNTKTAEKVREWYDRNPDILIKYADRNDLEGLSEEDKKLYAEITYSWLITHINEIKRAHKIEYLFAVVTQSPYDEQFFLFSAADPGAVRGPEYQQVYTIGIRSKVGEKQQNAMRQALSDYDYLVDAGEYVDYYSYLSGLDGHAVLIGLTYNTSEVLDRIGAQTRRGTLFTMVTQLGLALICLLLLYLYVLRPLRIVQQNIELYKETKDSGTVIENLSRVRSRNEIGALSEDVSGLASEIDDYLGKIEEITAEKERIGTELTLASNIQAAMLPNIFPPFPERNEFDIYAVMDPAREVGGDFYDFFMIDDDHLCLVIADVSGKGVPAALFMMASKIIISNNAMMGKSPAKILEDSNNSIVRNNRMEMFVTVWIGILEISTGILKAANAGHEYPAYMGSDGKFELLKDKHGFVIGGMANMKYSEYEVKMEPGSKIFVYTDGVAEATDAGQDMFGTERLTDALNSDRDAGPKDTIENVRKAVDGFVKDAEQFDDTTMLCLMYRGSN